MQISSIAIPIMGKMKNIIPNIGVTWWDTVATAINESEVNKYRYNPVLSHKYISGRACINTAIPIILGI